jgi:hypothetical protein
LVQGKVVLGVGCADTVVAEATYAVASPVTTVGAIFALLTIATTAVNVGFVTVWLLVPTVDDERCAGQEAIVNTVFVVVDTMTDNRRLTERGYHFTLDSNRIMKFHQVPACS